MVTITIGVGVDVLPTLIPVFKHIEVEYRLLKKNIISHCRQSGMLLAGEVVHGTYLRCLRLFFY